MTIRDDVAIPVPHEGLPNVTQPGPASTTGAEERISVAAQWQLMWWRFRKHRLAVIGGLIVLFFYFIVIFADILATSDPYRADTREALLPPQPIHWIDNGAFAPYVHPLVSHIDTSTFKRVFTADETRKVPVRFFAHGFEYQFLGIIPADLHLIGVEQGPGVSAENSMFLLGTDSLGRDMFSRLVFAIRTSLTIGLAGVVISLVLGVIIGGIAGYYAGWIDNVVMRLIELITSVPKIPLWMALGASLPKDWDITQIYLALTVVLSIFGWTGLAREVRGKLLSLRHEDFVTAAKLVGAGPRRIVFVHMVPLFLSHLIATTTLSVPGMIGGETALSFLGLGLRDPAISIGVLLHQTQNLQSVVLASWLMIPAIPLVVVVLAFNVLGDGLRDAADPYGI
jgi:peptide/nickel transport system permease protein